MSEFYECYPKDENKPWNITISENGIKRVVFYTSLNRANPSIEICERIEALEKENAALWKSLDRLENLVIDYDP